MGYCASQTKCKFFIAREDKERALMLIRQGYNLDDDIDSLGEALGEFGWDVSMDGERNVSRIHFEGDKWRDQEEILKTIAPVVKEGSYIEMCGEDGESWRLWFTGGEVKEIRPTVRWENEES